MMTISLQFHKLDSLQWPIAIVDYPARGQAPEIFAMRLITKQVFVPTSSLQVQFDERVRNLIVMARHLKLVNANLGKTRDLLPPRLISGKLSIEHLDIQFPPGMEESAHVN